MYLGRSVRTVQRWEKDFGLPVRRFGASKPESVFALPHQIDAWLLTSQGVNARSGGSADAESPVRADARASERAGAPTARGSRCSRRGWFIRMGLVACVGVAIPLLLWAAWIARQPGEGGAHPASAAPGGEPAEWQVDFDSLVVSDAEGTPLWRHAFQFPLRSPTYTRAPMLGNVLAGIRTSTATAGARSGSFRIRERGSDWSNHRLFLFNNDGTVRWTYQFAGEVRFGAATFGPPWPVRTVFLTVIPTAPPGVLSG